MIYFVGAMALLEVLTTALFLDQMRTDFVLLSYALVGLVVIWFAVNRLDRLSTWIMSDAAPPS